MDKNINLNSYHWSSSLSCANGSWIVPSNMENYTFFTFQGENISIQKNILLDDAIPTNNMNQMSKLREKQVQFKTPTAMNIEKLDTFRSATAHFKNMSWAKCVLYSWSKSNGKIWYWQNPKICYHITKMLVHKNWTFILKFCLHQFCWKYTRKIYKITWLYLQIF